MHLKDGTSVIVIRRRSTSQAGAAWWRRHWPIATPEWMRHVGRSHETRPVAPASGGTRVMVATDTVQPILNAILGIGETFAATLRLDAVLDSVIESGMRLAGGDSGSVMLLSDDGRELVVTAAIGPRASIILGSRQPASASVAGHALQSNTHMVVRGVAGREGGPRSRSEE